jgi:polar amino acid transport system substrate-binding protein
MDGFDVEVARAVAAKLGAKLKIDTPSWEIISAGRWRGRWDVCICSLTPDQKKAEVLDFVAPYYQAPAVLVTTAQNTAIQAPRDMNGKRIGVEQGSSYERYLQRELVIVAPDAKPISYPFEKVRIAPYANEDLAFQDLALGAGKRLDAVVSNLITAQARMAKTPGKFKLVGEPLYSEPNWVTTDKGDPEFQRKLVEIFAGLKKDGTLSRISQKWLGRDVSP